MSGTTADIEKKKHKKNQQQKAQRQFTQLVKNWLHLGALPSANLGFFTKFLGIGYNLQGIWWAIYNKTNAALSWIASWPSVQYFKFHNPTAHVVKGLIRFTTQS